jgi:hypothetical protein
LAAETGLVVQAMPVLTRLRHMRSRRRYVSASFSLRRRLGGAA